MISRYSEPKSLVRFPFWDFLNQPVFDPRYRLIVNPRRFWHYHRIELLERCLSKGCASKGRD